MKIVTSTGQTVATVTPEGQWTWANRALAPRYFADLVDQPELGQRDGGLVSGVLGEKMISLRHGTPEWVGEIHGRMLICAPDLIWQD